MEEPEPFYEVADVARVAGIAPATVKAAALAGKIAIAARTVRGGRLFLAAEVKRFAQARSAKTPANAPAA